MYKERPLKRWPFCSARRCFRCGAAGGRQAGRLWFQNMQDIHLSCGAANPISLVAQTGSTLGTAASQHLAAIAGGHSLSGRHAPSFCGASWADRFSACEKPSFQAIRTKTLKLQVPRISHSHRFIQTPKAFQSPEPDQDSYLLEISQFPSTDLGRINRLPCFLLSCFLITWLVQMRFFFTEKLKRENKIAKQKAAGHEPCTYSIIMKNALSVNCCPSLSL